ncbi:MAG: B12-binding domain-containing radical SAM protein [Deltaproteobacteria bacterium]|nr:B12-binding domain-containing radical SAM protein [Deltaproteobacteria bacterium]
MKTKPIKAPREMTEAPRLEPPGGRPVESRYALLVNPFYPKDPHSSFGKHVLTPTLALTSIAGATPDGWEVAYWDENLLKGAPPSNRIPEVVGITVHLTFAERAYELARWYRNMGSKVVLGGLHVTSCPEDAAPHADAIAIGDGTLLWPAILRDVEGGCLEPVYRAGFHSPYRFAPLPRRTILPSRSFLTTTSVVATRGCTNRCGFCYLATRGLRMPYQERAVQQVVREIADTGTPYAVFTDNNLGASKEYLARLCELLRPLDIIWSAAVTIDVTDDPALVRAMALSGCTSVFIGFETLSDVNLQASRKRTPRTREYEQRVSLLHDNGIQVNGSFVFGFDDDGKEVFEETAEWIEKNRLACATFHILTPYPGTPLFGQMEREGRLLHKDWNRYDTSHVVFRPARMTPEELLAGYVRTYQRLFSHASIWSRRPRDARMIPSYLAMSYLYKRSNWLWRHLIRHDLTHAAWAPFIHLSRQRHLAFRRKLSQLPLSGGIQCPGNNTPQLPNFVSRKQDREEMKLVYLIDGRPSDTNFSRSS